MFYVYEWYVVETGEVFYVGKGCGSRYKVRKHNRFFNDFIKRYDCESRIVKRFENEQEAFEYEHERITALKSIGQCVCNIYNGGCGGTTNWWTEERRQEYSRKNVMKSEEQRKRMSKKNPMKNSAVAEKTNSQKRKMVQIGNVIFRSVKEAAAYHNVTDGTIKYWADRGYTRDKTPCAYIEKCKYDNQQPS